MWVKVLLLLLVFAVSSCATWKACREIKSYLFEDSNCKTGYSVPYMSGPATCLEEDDLEKLKAECPMMF